MSYLEGRMFIVGQDEVVREAGPKFQMFAAAAYLFMLIMAISILAQNQKEIDSCVRSGGTWKYPSSTCMTDKVP
jgi:hypothetical protein